MRDIDLPPVIGLTGYASSGKDAVASVLERDHGYTRIAFADPVKRIAFAIGWDGTKRPAGNYPPDVIQGRLLLQELGMACREHIARGVFVAVARAHIDEVLANEGRVVIPDVRFSNEVDLVRGYYGTVIRIDRPGVEPMRHETERIDRLRIDVTLLNDGTLADLDAKVDSALMLITAGDAL